MSKAGIDELPQSGGNSAHTLEDYWNAPSGVGPLADEWKDKPHRLLYELIARLKSGTEEVRPCGLCLSGWPQEGRAHVKYGPRADDVTCVAWPGREALKALCDLVDATARRSDETPEDDTAAESIGRLRRALGWPPSRTNDAVVNEVLSRLVLSRSEASLCSCPQTARPAYPCPVHDAGRLDAKPTAELHVQGELPTEAIPLVQEAYARVVRGRNDAIPADVVARTREAAERNGTNPEPVLQYLAKVYAPEADRSKAIPADDPNCPECDGTKIGFAIGPAGTEVETKCYACEPPSEDVLRMVFAFDDQERKDLVRELAARVRATETELAKLRRPDATPPDRVAYLEAGLREMIAHHTMVADEERIRIDGMPPEEKIRERLIGKRKLRMVMVARLENLLESTLILSRESPSQHRCHPSGASGAGDKYTCSCGRVWRATASSWEPIATEPNASHPQEKKP